MSIAPAGVETFTSIASLRAAAPALVGTTIDFKGGFLGNAHGGVIGDIVAMSGSEGPVFRDQLYVVGPVAGTDLLFRSDNLRFSGHGASIRGVVELLGGRPLLTKATILSPQG